jgi:hypothetical protein
MSQWLLDNYRWVIPVFYGGLILITLARWVFADRRHRKEEQQINRMIESIQRRRGERP